MTRPRTGSYVWVTWLSKLMAGETQCLWAPWFRTHYTNYTRAPSDFQLAAWTADHSRMLDQLVKEGEATGEGVFKEQQNHFRVRRPSGLTIAGKPDLITVGKEGLTTVYDTKTGKPRQSDIIQVMLYMMCLPYASPLYKGKTIQGQVVYKSMMSTNIPADAIDKEFQGTVTYFLNLMEDQKSPARTPTPAECRFCDITSEDCPDRIEFDESAEEGLDDPEIPL